jgi:4-diphosphocytidyl-2-C-methyl-D-erythritol kinase
MEETAFAKINLALHVSSREADGYHRIETIFAFCEEGDRLEVGGSDELSLEVAGPFGEEIGRRDDNLVLRAARALLQRCGTAQGARLRLDKRLPVASGLGGGSADAAAALRLLCRWWDIAPGEPELLDIAAGLGADVPACLASRTVRGEGRGDRLVPWDGHGLSGAPLLIVNPLVPLSTAAVFAAWDGVDRGPLESLERARNDLEPAAISRVPAVAEVLASLEGASIARMSGSGASCFGLYSSESERDRAAERIGAARPGWWLLPTRLR